MAALAALVFAIAWFSMPRGWIEQQAARQVAQMKGATVRWTRMTPAIQWPSIGVKLEGLTVRIPDVGPPKTELRVSEVFVRMKLIPLLLRRVEVSSARLDGAWVTLTEQPPLAGGPPGGPPAPKFQIMAPRVDFHDMNLRTRDTLGSGTELKGLNGDVVLAGTFDAPSSIRISAKADSLFWKPSAEAANVPLPSPLVLDAALESRGDPGVLEMTRGSVDLGPLRSTMVGTVRFPKRGAGGGATVDLVINGKAQRVDSGDRAFRGFAAATPAKWDGTAAWDIHAGGAAPDIVTNGTLDLTGLSVRAQENAFLIDKVHAVWKTQADRTFIANGSGSGSGVSLTFQAKGLLAPGGATTGGLYLRAPATRLNGLLPNAPKWSAGQLEVRASFELKPPAKPTVRWTVQGTGIEGTIQGMAHPVHGLGFDVEGNDVSADIRSFRTTVGSTTMNLTGTLVRGKPLSTGTFKITMDRIIAEEWAPPAEGGSAPTKTAAPAPASLPIPIGAFTGSLEIGEARSGAMRATNISTPVRYDGRSLVAAPIKGSIGTGTFGGTLTVQSPFQKPSYTFHMDVNRAPVEQVSAGTMPFASAVTGFLSGAIDLSGEGFPSPRPNETLRGLLKGTLDDGKLKLTPAVIAIARSLGITTASELPLTQETHTMRIQGSKMLIDQARGDLGQDKAEMTGSVGLDHMLDLNVLLKLAPSRVKGSSVLAKLGQYARDSEGRLPVGLRITGLDRAPKIVINTEALMEAATKQLTGEAGKRLLDELTKKLSRRPDSLHKADSTLAADSTRNLGTVPGTPLDSADADPIKKAGDVLKQIFGK